MIGKCSKHFFNVTILLAAAAILCMPLSAQDIAAPETVHVPAGAFVTGSSESEREAAYQLDEQAYGHSRTRKSGWYNREAKRRSMNLPAFDIMKHLVTNADYARFVQATGHRAPDVMPGPGSAMDWFIPTSAPAGMPGKMTAFQRAARPIRSCWFHWRTQRPMPTGCRP